MRLQKNILAATTIAVAIAGPGLAGEILPPPTTTDWVNANVIDGEASTKAFVGLNWTFGAGPTPELVLGVARGKTQADGNVVGAKVAAFLDVSGGFALDKMKLTGLYGSRDIQGELGFGYNFQRGNIFGVAGANSSNYAAGVDVYGGAELEPYVGVHSIGLFGNFGYTCDGVSDPGGITYQWTLVGLDVDQCEFSGIDNGN